MDRENEKHIGDNEDKSINSIVLSILHGLFSFPLLSLSLGLGVWIKVWVQRFADAHDLYFENNRFYANEVSWKCQCQGNKAN